MIGENIHVNVDFQFIFPNFMKEIDICRYYSFLFELYVLI
jgi:hypothetical protein